MGLPTLLPPLGLSFSVSEMEGLKDMIQMFLPALGVLGTTAAATGFWAY